MAWLATVRRRAASELGQLAQACDVVVGAGHQHRPCGRACCRDVERCESQARGVGGEGVDVGSLNLGPKTATVAEAQVIGHDDEEIGPSSRRVS